MLNQLVYDFVLWLGASHWSTSLRESYYMYSWVETAHVLSLVPSLGTLFFIDLRMLGMAMPRVSASVIARQLQLPMFVGFGLMVTTGLLLFFAVPVRSSQSVWFRIKFMLLLGAAVNAWVFNRRMKQSVSTWDNKPLAPRAVRLGALLSLLFWTLVVICGRLIAYDWFDCSHGQSGFINGFAGCIEGQTQF